MPTRIPKPEDFAPLSPGVTLTLTYPLVPEATTAILILLHGLGDSEASFTSFAKSIALPAVLAITVRGVSPLPPSLLGLPDAANLSTPTRNFHWGDDLTISPSTGDLCPDPGFSKARDAILERLIRGTLVEKCGWEMSDILLFGFGQGGSLSLGLASMLRSAERFVDVIDSNQQDAEGKAAFKGVVSVGGPLPASMVPTISSREKSRTPVLICHGRSSEAIDEDAMDAIKREFGDVREVNWRKPDDGMPQNRDEMLPIMQFFAERLRSGW